MNNILISMGLNWDVLYKGAPKYILICISIVIIISIAIFIRIILKHATVKILSLSDKSNITHSKTILTLLVNIEKYIIFFIAIIMILNKLNIDTSAILTSAGVLGLAISFGAKNLVADCISGFFLIFDGVIRVGDVITVGEVSGDIEKITLRNTFVREYAGRLWAIPNGEIRKIGNFNRDFCRAIVEVPFSNQSIPKENLDVLQSAADSWAEENKDIIIESPTAQGVMTYDGSNMIFRIVVKVQAQKHWNAQVDLKRFVVDQLAKSNKIIPIPKQEVVGHQLFK